MKKVLFIDKVHPFLQDEMTQWGWDCINAENLGWTEIESILPQVEGIVIRSRFSINETFLRKAKKLQFIARSGAGMENIDVPYALSKGIQLFSAPEGNRNAVAEHLLGSLLGIMNYLHSSHDEIKRGKWDRNANTGEELDGKTLGIIGYGNNGSAFAKKLRGFDVKVLAFDKYKTGFGDDFVRESTLQSIQQNADVLSFHVPLNVETHHYFNPHFLDQFHKPIYLLNASRGKIVDTKALIAGLQTGQVKGAALDVHEFENTAFEQTNTNRLYLDELVKHRRVLLTPHVAGWSKESYFKLSKILSEKLKTHYIDPAILK